MFIYIYVVRRHALGLRSKRFAIIHCQLPCMLFYGNKLFEQDLHRIESVHADTPIVSVAGEPEEVQDCCSQLYSILTGLLRGKPLLMLRQVES